MGYAIGYGLRQSNADSVKTRIALEGGVQNRQPLLFDRKRSNYRPFYLIVEGYNLTTLKLEFKRVQKNSRELLIHCLIFTGLWDTVQMDFKPTLE